MEIKKEYEPAIPITHEELYRIVKNINIRDLEENYFGYAGPSDKTESIRLKSVSALNGDVLFRSPDESDNPIVVISDSDIKHKMIKRGLEDLLEFKISEVPQEVAV